MKGTVTHAMIDFSLHLYEKHGGTIRKLPDQVVLPKRSADLDPNTSSRHSQYFQIDENMLPERELAL